MWGLKQFLFLRLRLAAGLAWIITMMTKKAKTVASTQDVDELIQVAPPREKTLEKFISTKFSLPPSSLSHLHCPSALFA